MKNNTLEKINRLEEGEGHIWDLKDRVTEGDHLNNKKKKRVMQNEKG